ncbi:glutamyl-tRNA reductase [Stetteria hydrogenophila]
MKVFYASHKDAGLEVVSRLQGLKGRVYDAVYPRVSGVVVLSTCNRFEVYVDGGEGEALRGLREAVGGLAGEFRLARGAEAARRLLRVAAGLESAILGEPEILGQVRRAWLEARGAGYTTPLLDEAFHAAILAGKRVREETGLSQGTASYPTAAVELAARLLGGLDGARVLVAGTGEAAEGMVAYLCSKYEPAMVTVAGRRLEAAARVASRCRAASATRLSPDSIKGRYDAVLVAVSGAPDLSWLSSVGRVVVDISTPRAVRDAYGLEEVEAVVREAVEMRARHVPQAEAIIEEELEKLMAKLRWRSISPVLEAVNSYAEALAAVEASRIASRLGVDAESLRVELRSFYRRLLHPLYAALRRAAREGSVPPGLAEAIRGEYLKRLEESS